MTPTLFKALREVKQTIEQQVKNDVNRGRKPSETIETLFKTQDVDTVKWFFAETVKAAEWDGRFSRKTKEWARQLWIPELNQEDGKKYGQISDGIVHRAHLDQLVRTIIEH